MLDKQILRGLKANDTACYEGLIDTYSRYCAAIIIKVAGSRLTNEDVEELCADIFIKLWTDRHQLEIEEEKLKGYIAVMARNRTLNRLRGNKCEVIPLEEDTVDYSTPEVSLLEGEEKQLINDVIDTLPEPDREIFIRRYFYMEKLGDIASHLQINVQTVGTKLFRGKKKLEQALKERGIAYE